MISAILIGFFVGDRRMSAERVSALAEIDTYVQVLTDATAKSKARPELDGKLQGIANQMLGSSLETVDSEVRRRLNRACEELGFNDFSVTTGTSVGRPTPAKKEFKSPDSRKMRDEIDFMEVQATVIARASVDKVYRLIFRVDAEPWIKRIESVRLNPSTDGQQVGVTLRLTTPFMPGYVGKTPPKFDPATIQLADRYAALFSSNPFRIQPPPMDVPAAIAGVIEGPSGPEAWLRHLPSGSNVVLHPTMTAGELVFRGVEYDFAVFESPSGACRIQVGTNLTQRSALLASPTNG